jgi:hypothetical protein
MPKITDYPTGCSFSESLEIVGLINKVGGKGTLGFIADNLKVKANTGAFRSKIAGALKYGMIEKRGNELFLNELAQKYLHPISDNEKEEALKMSLLSVPIFKSIVKQCEGQEVDKKFVESILIRMLNVNNNIAGKVAGYFLKANEEIHFLEKLKGNKFLIPKNFIEGNTIPEKTNTLIEEKQTKKEKKLETIDVEIFDLLILIGKFLKQDEKDLDKIKRIIDNKKNNLSHAELISDLLDKDNPKILEKLVDALKKDLEIKEKITDE